MSDLGPERDWLEKVDQDSGDGAASAGAGNASAGHGLLSLATEGVRGVRVFSEP